MGNEFSLSQGQGHKLEKAIARNDGLTTDIEWLCKGANFQSMVRLARGEAELVLKSVPVTAQDEVKVKPDLILRPNRTTAPTLPSWATAFLHPELQLTGPTEFNLATDVEQWLHDGQKNGGRVKGQIIYDHLKTTELLESCIGLSGLLAIQAQGVTVFRQHFSGKAVFAWKSVVRPSVGNLRVPCLYGDGRVVRLDWLWLGGSWNDNRPALRFGK